MLIMANRHAVKTSSVQHGWLLHTPASYTTAWRGRVSHFSWKDIGPVMPSMMDTRAQRSAPVYKSTLTLYEDAHISTAEVNIVGNLAPVNAGVVPVKRTKEKQSVVSHFHALWHFIVQSAIHKIKKKTLERNQSPAVTINQMLNMRSQSISGWTFFFRFRPYGRLPRATFIQDTYKNQILNRKVSIISSQDNIYIFFYYCNAVLAQTAGPSYFGRFELVPETVQF